MSGEMNSGPEYPPPRCSGLSNASMALLLGLALSTTMAHRKFSTNLCKANIEQRREIHERILHNSIEPPYRYRVFFPLLTEGLSRALGYSPLGSVYPPGALLDGAQFSVVFASLATAYIAFAAFLSFWFPREIAVLGGALLAAVIPSSITGFYIDGDFVTLAFYALGLLGFASGKLRWVSLVFVVGALHRVQIVFLVALYVAFEAARGRLLEAKTVQTTGAYLGLFALVYYLVRDVRGSAPTPYTVYHHLYGNIDLMPEIFVLWGSIVLPTVLLALVGFGRKPRFFRYATIALAPYIVAFPLKGNLWELAKALPMFLILIPMALCTLFPCHGACNADGEGKP